VFQPVADESSTWRGRGETHKIDREHLMQSVFERREGNQVILQATFNTMESLSTKDF
jgi:hypothetical protein